MRRPEIIWILEDDNDVADVLNAALGAKFNLHFFKSIKGFKTALLRRRKPDLVIADIRLEDGYFTDYLADQVKKKEKFAFPFLVTSQVDDQDILRFCFKSGAMDYLIKPFNLNALVVKVDKLLGLFNSEKSNEDKKRKLEALSEIMTIKLRGLEAELTNKEKQIIFALINSGKSVISKKEIQEKAWGKHSTLSKQLDVHILNKPFMLRL